MVTFRIHSEAKNRICSLTFCCTSNQHWPLSEVFKIIVLLCFQKESQKYKLFFFFLRQDSSNLSGDSCHSPLSD